MKSLNLPPFEYKVKKQNGQIWIFDMIRKRYVVLTPEEWGRQHFIHFLIESKGYPAQLIAVEKEIQVCGMKRHSSIICPLQLVLSQLRTGACIFAGRSPGMENFKC